MHTFFLGFLPTYLNKLYYSFLNISFIYKHRHLTSFFVIGIKLIGKFTMDVLKFAKIKQTRPFRKSVPKVNKTKAVRRSNFEVKKS